MEINKKFHVITYGCQQNIADSEKIKGVLNSLEYTETTEKNMADIIVINTCCIRENAELKFFGVLGAFKEIKLRNPNKIIAISGCMMQQEHIVNRIKEKYAHVDIIMGTNQIKDFARLIDEAKQKSKRRNKILINTEDISGDISEDIPIKRDDKYKANIPIINGCNNFCSYCVVPYVRGRERSREKEQIIKEIQNLTKFGCKEITLLGQNVNSYGKNLKNGENFPNLLREINQIEGIEQIRFLTSHPKDFSLDLISAIKDCDKVCKHIHLPFQSGSNTILKAMNRKYTAEEYLEKIRIVKDAIPDITISTDVIVGFPGETENDFKETLKIMEEVRFEQAFMYLYSRRKNTPADTMSNQIDEKIKHRRFDELVAVHDRISLEHNQEMLNKVVIVRAEGISKTDKNKITGRTEGNKVINFTVNDIDKINLGDIVNILITDVKTWSLSGEEIKEENNGTNIKWKRSCTRADLTTDNRNSKT